MLHAWPLAHHHRHVSPQDVYALGVLLWEMLAGEVPWHAASMFHIAYAVCVLGQRPPRSAIVPRERCPDKLWALISACWDTDPQVSGQGPVEGGTDTCAQVAHAPSWALRAGATPSVSTPSCCRTGRRHCLRLQRERHLQHPAVATTCAS